MLNTYVFEKKICYAEMWSYVGMFWDIYKHSTHINLKYMRLTLNVGKDLNRLTQMNWINDKVNIIYKINFFSMHN